MEYHNQNKSVKSRPFIIAVALAAFGYFAYSFYKHTYPGEIVTILADAGETKIKRDGAGEITALHAENLIYENLRPGKSNSTTRKTANLLPEPEQPVNINNKAGSAPGNDAIDLILEGLAEKTEFGLPGQSRKEEAPDVTAAAQYASDKTLRIVKVDKKSGVLLPLPSSSNSSNTRYKLQLASVKTETDGQKEWDRLKKKYPKALGKLPMSLKKIEHPNGSIFYSVQAGNFNNMATAKAACKKLSANGQNCILTK